MPEQTIGVGDHFVAIDRASGLADSRLRFWQGVKGREIMGRVVVMLVLALGVFVIMIPMGWVISVSLQTPIEFYSYPPKWIPSSFYLGNFIQVIELLPFWQLLTNTLIITGGRLVGVLISASLTAFAFSRLRSPIRERLFLAVLGTMMLPGQVTLVPTFILFSKLGWVNTFRPLIVPYFFGGGAFNIFLLRQFFNTIPLEYDDAARIDGCGYLQLYLRIILPLSAPAMAAVAIFAFREGWNDFMGPLIYLRSMEQSTLALGLHFFNNSFQPDWTLLMAMSLMVMTPMVLMFFFSQRMFIQGIVITGIKG